MTKRYFFLVILAFFAVGYSETTSINTSAKLVALPKINKHPDIKLTIKVLVSEVHDSPRGRMYPVQYTLSNMSNDNITIYNANTNGKTAFL